MANEAERSPAQRHWKRNLQLVGLLLAVWFLVSYGCGILWVEELNAYSLGGFPLGFWFAQQGSMLVFIVLITIYCVRMDKIDEEARQSEEKS